MTEQEDCCAICLEDLNHDLRASSSLSSIICCICPASCDDREKQPMFVLPCGHAFHPACIRAWMYVGGIKGYSCPMCRKSFSYCCVPQMLTAPRTVVVWLVMLYVIMLAALAIFIVVLDMTSSGRAGRDRMLLEARAPAPLMIMLNA